MNSTVAACGLFPVKSPLLCIVSPTRAAYFKALRLRESPALLSSSFAPFRSRRSRRFRRELVSVKEVTLFSHFTVKDPIVLGVKVGVTGSVESSSEGGNGALPVGHGVLEGGVPPQKTNGSVAIVPVSPANAIASGNGVDVNTWTDPCAAGQVEACAALRAAESDTIEPPLEDKWSRRKTYSSLQRTLEVWSFAFSFFLQLWWTNSRFSYPRNGFTPEAISEKKKKLAAWLRKELVRLGPTFIKIGQQFSTRVDVLSQEFIKELEQLQDNVPPFDSRLAVQIVEESYGKKLSDTFEVFNKTPIAAASLGQVHMARLKGETVVVKVQRPGLKELFDIDLKNIRVLAQILQSLDPKSDGAARDWVAIYDECSRILYEEIDYVKEAANAERFKTNFEQVDWVKVPQVFWEYTTSEVLVMEYCPGTKINNASKIDELGMNRQQLARYAVESYLQQILRHGFFHADPHPGNVSVDTVNGGRLIYYDFGMMGSIPGNVKEGLVELFYGVYKKDVEKCVSALVEMGVLVKGGDMTAIRRTGEFFLTSFEERLKQQKDERETDPETYTKSYKPQRTKDESQQMRKKILANIGEDLLVTAADQPFRFPAEFTFVVRAFSVLDGIGKSLDNRFDISEIAAPYARDFVLEGRPQLKKLQEELGRRAELQRRAVVNLFRGPNMIEEMNQLLGRMERGELKLRVRALEAERALSRVESWQSALGSAVVASTLVNVGTMFRLNAMGWASIATFALALFFALMSMASFLKVKSLEKKERQITGAAA